MTPSLVQILVVAALALLLFKGRELPGLLSNLGKGLAGLRRELAAPSRDA